MLERSLYRALRIGSGRQLRIMLRTALAMAVPGVPAGKVFAIGFNKTGTSSLHYIFEKLGYTSYHGVAWRDTNSMSIFFKFDAFSDDVPKDFRKLDRLFKGSKFILQVRSLDSWIDSRIEHVRRKNLVRAQRGEPQKPLADEAMVRDWVWRRERHHREVIAHFADRPDDLLVINFIEDPDAASRVARFLGYSGDLPKPHENSGARAQGRLAHGALIQRALEGLGLPREEWGADVTCPSLGNALAAEPPVG
jgi:hypothetical protein